jgi:hypothetical protein
MATNEANDEHLLSPAMLSLVPRNAFYFLVGRHSGLVPYFFPGVLIGALWLARIRRSPLWQMTTSVGGVLATLGLLVLAPGLWNGGEAPLGIGISSVFIQRSCSCCRPARACCRRCRRWSSVSRSSVGFSCILRGFSNRGSILNGGHPTVADRADDPQ